MVTYMRYLGVTPEAIPETYPLSQHEKEYDEEVLKESINAVLSYLLKHRGKYSSAIFVILQKNLEEQVLNLARKLKDTIKVHVIQHYNKDAKELIKKLKDHLHVM